MSIGRRASLGLALVVSFAACYTGEHSSTNFEIPYEKYTLDNGLDVILHQDRSDPIVAIATLMHVGSSREEPGKTGFAHFFEHMSFNDSENVPRGANRKMIGELGGTRNGGTWTDGTIYYEVVPRDAFEKLMWIDSDRLGYMINTVSESALENEKQVVKNEKRQRVDNRPYGHTRTGKIYSGLPEQRVFFASGSIRVGRKFPFCARPLTSSTLRLLSVDRGCSLSYSVKRSLGALDRGQGNQA